jgi:nucleotide-binding universal stress UspA family protein
MKILLAIDDSKFAQAALEMLITQSRPQETEVLVVHVTEPITLLFAPETMAEFNLPTPQLNQLRQEHLKHGRELVAAASAKIRESGFQADSAVYEGDARAEIIDMAAQWHADLIVVGSHGRKGLDRFLLGSVSEYVARHAPCSVEIVRMPANR